MIGISYNVVNTVAFSLTGNLMAYGGDDNTIWLENVTDRAKNRTKVAIGLFIINARVLIRCTLSKIS